MKFMKRVKIIFLKKMEGRSFQSLIPPGAKDDSF
jgi:hypothetical protein